MEPLTLCFVANSYQVSDKLKQQVQISFRNIQISMKFSSPTPPYDVSES